MSPVRLHGSDGSQIPPEHLTDKPQPAYLFPGKALDVELEDRQTARLWLFLRCASVKTKHPVSPVRAVLNPVAAIENDLELNADKNLLCSSDVSGMRHQINSLPPKI
jgi:hypothetical protein